MCGIVGIWLKNKSDEVISSDLNKAIKSIEHRGPNAINSKVMGHVGLAHARLSIIDLSNSANQPMTNSNQNFTIVFNGEIYDFQILKQKLSQSTQLKTSSDTEVILEYISEFGIESISDFNGFFSILIYDLKNNTLHFARDRFGIKPLYVYEDDNQIIFASELNAFFSFNINTKLNDESINALFELTYIPSPLSILKYAKQVLPGYLGSVKNNKITQKQYYQLINEPELKIDYKSATNKVKELVEKAVEKRMVSDVPLGTFLSGGLDSSIISLVAKKYKNDLKTFSIGFESDYFDESKYANQMALHISSNHNLLKLKKQDFKESFNDFLKVNDQPFADSSAFAVYLLSKFAKQNVTVCLSGDGADELFGGYRKHEAEFKIRNTSIPKAKLIIIAAKLLSILPISRHNKWGDLNRKIQKYSKGLSSSMAERYNNWLLFIPENEKQKLLINLFDIKKSLKFKLSNNLNDVLLADQSFVLPNDMLVKVDRMSMQHALEVRTPFLDHELVDFVNKLPSDFKVNNNGRKQILVDAFKEELPEEIYSRQKKGFEIPIFEWLDEELKTQLSTEIFSKSYILKQGVFNYDYICGLQNKWDSARVGEAIYLIWTLIIFQNWWDQYIRLNGKKNKDS